VSPGQHAGADRDRSNGARVASVDPGFAAEDLAADDARLQFEQDFVDVSAGRRRNSWRRDRLIDWRFSGSRST